MQDYDLPLNEDLSENFPSMNPAFPYVYFEGEVDLYSGGYVLWHWHEEPEFCYVLSGEIEYHVEDKVYILSSGSAMFINSNVLHMIKNHSPSADAIIIPQIFNKLFLIGHHQSVFDTTYYRPIVNNKNLPCYLISPPDGHSVSILELLIKCYLCAKNKEAGYEIYVRNYISEIWFLLYSAVKDQLQTKDNIQDINNERIKQMLTYINSHYSEKITLKAIAASASISERECIRCFKKYLQLTPFQYLLEYRIDIASNMLLNTDVCITEIALQCGFETSSYFSRKFKDFMQCTPKAYRDKHHSS